MAPWIRNRRFTDTASEQLIQNSDVITQAFHIEESYIPFPERKASLHEYYFPLRISLLLSQKAP